MVEQMPITKEQARSFALFVVADIKNYVKNNQAAYQEWLKEYEQIKQKGKVSAWKK